MMRPRIPTFDPRRVKPPPKVADSIYSTPEYRQWRAIVIARAGGKCQDPTCKARHWPGQRLFADHIVELRDGGAPFDPANGQALCGSADTRKTTAVRAARAAGWPRYRSPPLECERAELRGEMPPDRVRR